MISFKSKKKENLYAKKVLRENVRIIEKPKPKKIIAAAKKSSPVQPPKAPSKQIPQKPAVKQAAPKPVQKPSEKVIAKKTSLPSKNPLPKIQEMPKVSEKEVIALVLPKSVATLNVEEIEQEMEEDHEDSSESYGVCVYSKIEDSLSIKPNTFVSIDLTLNKKGEVVSVKHIYSSDEITKEYVLGVISKLEFPHFFGEIANKSEYTFSYKITPKQI